MKILVLSAHPKLPTAIEPLWEDTGFRRLPENEVIVASDWDEYRELEQLHAQDATTRILLLYMDPALSQVVAPVEEAPSDDNAEQAWVAASNRLLDVARVSGRRALLLDLSGFLAQRNFIITLLREGVYAATRSPQSSLIPGSVSCSLYESLQALQKIQLNSVIHAWIPDNHFAAHPLMQQLLRENMDLIDELHGYMESAGFSQAANGSAGVTQQETEVEAMKRSLSWRITKPLRALGELFFALRRHFPAHKS